jgi:hypothetical protein
VLSYNTVLGRNRRALSHILVLLLLGIVFLQQLTHGYVSQGPGYAVDANLNSRSKSLGVDVVV